MANMIKDLLAPEQAKLLDDQLRKQSLQQGVTNYGNDAMGKFLTAASGAQRASAGFGMAAERAIAGRQMGANEAGAIAAQKKRDELIKQARLEKQAREAKEAAALAENQRRWDAEFGIKETNAAQQTTLFNQMSEQNELTLQAAKNKIQRDGQYSLAVADVLENIEGLSNTERLFVGTMDNEKALEYLTKREKVNQNKFKNQAVVSSVTNTFFPQNRPATESSTALNNRYLGAAAAYRKAGLTQQAEDLELERKAVIEQRKTVEEREQSVKDKWDSNVGVRNLNNKIGAANQGLALLEQGGGLAELAAQIKFFKVNDPESVVKESEIEMANQADGLLSSVEAAISRKGGEGILSPSLRKQLNDFFTLSGTMAVEGYNEAVEEQKLRYSGRDMDVDFMFGGRKSLRDTTSTNEPTQSPVNYRFDLNDISKPVNEEVVSYLGGEYKALGSEPKRALLGFYNQVKGNPAGLEALRKKAIEEYGFDAVGYMIYSGGI